MEAHTHTHRKAVRDRISRAAGHLEAVGRMVDEDRDCREILIQLSAIRSAINGIGRLVLTDHIEHCMVHAAETGDDTALRALDQAIGQFLK